MENDLPTIWLKIPVHGFTKVDLPRAIFTNRSVTLPDKVRSPAIKSFHSRKTLPHLYAG